MTDPQVIQLGEDEIRVVDINAIEPDPDNPNVEPLATFNELVADMKENGVTQPPVVRPHPTVEGRYILVGGEHRWKAAKIVGLTSIPVVVKTSWDEDAGKVQLVKQNMLHGKLDPVKFTELWTRLAKKYGPDELKRLMGFTGQDGELKRLVKSLTKGMPASLAAEVTKRAEKIRRVEDLAAMVQSIFATSGSTVAAHFIAFTFGGQTHLMVQASKDTFKPIAALAETCREAGVELDRVLAQKAACACSDCMTPFTQAAAPVEPTTAEGAEPHE